MVRIISKKLKEKFIRHLSASSIHGINRIFTSEKRLDKITLVSTRWQIRLPFPERCIFKHMKITDPPPPIQATTDIANSIVNLVGEQTDQMRSNYASFGQVYDQNRNNRNINSNQGTYLGKWTCYAYLDGLLGCRCALLRLYLFFCKMKF